MSALAALLFLYGQLLDVELPWLDELVRARKPRRLPVVLSRAEVAAILTEQRLDDATIATALFFI